MSAGLAAFRIHSCLRINILLVLVDGLPTLHHAHDRHCLLLYLLPDRGGSVTAIYSPAFSNIYSRVVISKLIRVDVLCCIICMVFVSSSVNDVSL